MFILELSYLAFSFCKIKYISSTAGAVSLSKDRNFFIKMGFLLKCGFLKSF